MDSDLLEEARDVFFGAGRPGERRAVVHELSGHDERVPAFQLAVVALAVVMNPKAAFKHSQHAHLVPLIKRTFLTHRSVSEDVFLDLKT